MSETPRTDALLVSIESGKAKLSGPGLTAAVSFLEPQVLENHARQLERELAQAQARCAEQEKALTRLGSMEAFRGSRFLTEHDAELIARIDFARAALKEPR